MSIGSCISDSVFLELLREKNYYYDLLLKTKIQAEGIQKDDTTTLDELNQIGRDLKAYFADYSSPQAVRVLNRQHYAAIVHYFQTLDSCLSVGAVNSTIKHYI